MNEINEKYLFLPEKFWNNHEVCFNLIRQIEELKIDEIFNKFNYPIIELGNDSAIPDNEENLLDFLERTGRNKEHDLIVKNRIVQSLIIDTCYFLQEALHCSLKMRLSVVFALLRKPFVYNLILMLRIIYEEKFIEKFNTTENFDSTGIRKENIIELIRMSLQDTLSLKAENCDFIYDLIFNKSNPESIIYMSEKALHLSITKNKPYNTERKNLNFIFSTYDDNLLMWDYLYSKLPLLILFLLELFDLYVLPIADIDYVIQFERLEKRVKIFNNF